MRNIAKFLIVGVFGLAAAGVPAAQTQQPKTEGVITPAQGQPIFRSGVNLVTTDVIVRDNRGQFLADLKGSDFEIFEDGVKQEMASLELIHGGRAFNMQAPPPAPLQEGIIIPRSRPMNDAAGRIFLFFVDDLHLTFRDTARTREIFKKMVKNLVHDGDMFGLVTTGPSSMSIQMTYDKKTLEEAIGRITGDGLKPSDIMQQQEGPNGPMELRYRAHVAFSTAHDLMKNLEKVHNRRKAVIYVSSGYDFNPFEISRIKQQVEQMGASSADLSNYTGGDQGDASHLSPFATKRNDQSGAQFADTDLAIELMELARDANRANATMYTIDPRGLVAGQDLDEQVEPVEWDNYVRKTQDSLRSLAELTGGIAVVNQNDFDKAIKRIDAETSDYYVLGYYSTNPDPLRRTRRLEIKAKRPNATVWSRSSYSLPLPEGDKDKVDEIKKDKKK